MEARRLEDAAQQLAKQLAESEQIQGCKEHCWVGWTGGTDGFSVSSLVEWMVGQSGPFCRKEGNIFLFRFRDDRV